MAVRSGLFTGMPHRCGEHPEGNVIPEVRASPRKGRYRLATVL